MAKFKFDDSGFKELEKKLKHMSDEARKLSGTREVPLGDLLTPNFMAKYTKHVSVDDFFADADFKVETEADWDNLPEGVLDKYVRSKSSFTSWDDMLGIAAEHYYRDKLKF